MYIEYVKRNEMSMNSVEKITTIWPPYQFGNLTFDVQSESPGILVVSVYGKVFCHLLRSFPTALISIK
jgi:hypothetical protein